MKFKKSQISIFIIIIVIVIVLFIFLILTSKEEKKEDLEENLINLIPKKTSNLFPLKDNVDYCLDLEVKKALIIAGFRGGFIEDKGEFYAPGIDSIDFYIVPDFLDKLGIDITELNEKVLIHVQTTDSYDPNINKIKTLNFPDGSTTTIYSHSIKEDMEKYVLEGFINCIDLKKYEENGYEIGYEPNIAYISSEEIPGQKYILEKKIGNVGDKVTSISEDITYNGEIINNDNERSTVNFTSFSTILPLKNTQVRNTNSKIKINLTFNNENIIAELDFPIKIFNNNFETSYKYSSIIINNRFKELLNIANEIGNKKYRNRSLDLTNQTDLDSLSNQLNYLSQTKLNDLKIKKTIINNSISEITTIYSIIDEDSKIYGKNYTFNFGYYNTAPSFNDTLITNNGLNKIDDSVVYIAAAGNPYTKNLRLITKDDQFEDNFNFFFYEQNSPEFKLHPNGTFTFLSNINKAYHYLIRKSDGETEKSESITIITGISSNENNEDAKNCFNVENYVNTNFPIDGKFKNKVFDSIDPTTNYHDTYAFKIKDLEFHVEFSDICLYNKDYIAQYEILDSYGYPISSTYENLELSYDDDGKLTIPPPSYNEMYTINLKILEKLNPTNQFGENYTLNVYPTECLGPSEKDANYFPQTCCNLTEIEAFTEPTPTLPSYSTFPTEIENLKSGPLFIEEMYFTYNYNLDFTNNIIWDSTILGDKATSLLRGDLEVTCEGNYPLWEHNSIKITNPYSSNVLGSTKSVNLQKQTGTTYSDISDDSGTSIEIDMDLGINPTYSFGSDPICNFAILKNYSNLIFDFTTTNLNLISGTVAGNPSPNLGHIPATGTFTTPNIRCSDDVYAKRTINPFPNIWETNSFGPNSKDGTITTSYGFCRRGTSACDRGDEEPPHPLINEDSKTESGECQDYFFQIGNKIIQGGKGNDILCSGTDICNTKPSRNSGNKLISTFEDYVCVPALPHCTKKDGQIITKPSPLPECTGSDIGSSSTCCTQP